MAISAHFRHRGFTPANYDEAIRRLDAAGEGHPAGRLHHIAVDADGEIEVFDIWESPEALQKWGPEGFVPDPDRARRRTPPLAPTAPHGAHSQVLTIPRSPVRRIQKGIPYDSSSEK